MPLASEAGAPPACQIPPPCPLAVDAHAAVTWSGDRVMVLGVLPGYGGSSGAGVNNRRDVVGTSWDPLDDTRAHAFLWRGGRMLDLNDVHLRQAKQRGVKIVINTDSHHTSHMDKIRYGVLQARRAWLTKDDVLNTLPAAKFVEALKKRA